jgi:hypothetical protein
MNDVIISNMNISLSFLSFIGIIFIISENDLIGSICFVDILVIIFIIFLILSFSFSYSSLCLKIINDASSSPNKLSNFEKINFSSSSINKIFEYSDKEEEEEDEEEDALMSKW